MIWANILKIKIRPADEALSPTVQDFLRPTRNEHTVAAYNNLTGEYSFDVGDKTPEEIAQSLAEETTHHAQHVIGTLDPDFQRYQANWVQDFEDLTEKYIEPMIVATLKGEENTVVNLIKGYAQTYFSMLFSVINEKTILESHAKESQNLEPVDKAFMLADAYILRSIDMYLAMIPVTLTRIKKPELLQYFLPEYEKFKTKISAFIDKMVEDFLFESLPDRTKKYRNFAIENIDTGPMNRLKELIRGHVIDNMEETMDSVKEELNA